MMENYKPSIWEQNASLAGGATESERYLAKLARRAFLSFWSYSNPYTDEGGGKELCDFMVVFGNDIIIFSDKHCRFPTHADIKVAWHRWYRSAIDKSTRQLEGAASFIERFPHRIYLDADCKNPLPIPLPSSDRRIHLIAVTRGSAEAAKNYWGKSSSSSFLINTTIKDFGNKDHPFMVGKAPIDRRFIHILDELTLDILLNELDTVRDFVDYLTKKEAYLSNSDADFIICGEEDLLASYLLSPLPDDGGFSFPSIPQHEKLAFLREGLWAEFSGNKLYSSWKKRMERSYEWDRLIEHQTSHIQRKTANVLYKHDAGIKDLNVHEVVLRMMAEEGRKVRQILANAHEGLFKKAATAVAEDRFVRTLVVPPKNKRAYVLLVLVRSPEQSYDEYREVRRGSLLGYCRASFLRFKGVEEVVGIASDQLNDPMLTQDFVYMQDDSQRSQIEMDHEIAHLRSIGIWKDHWTSK